MKQHSFVSLNSDQLIRSISIRRRRKKVGYTNMYLQAVWQLSDGLLQEQCHEQEVQLRHIGVFGQ